MDATAATPRLPRSVDALDHLGRTRRLVIRLDRDSPIPTFEQVRAQLAVMVAVGLLQPGARLPTIRNMAAALELAPNTVARCYRELEIDGVVTGQGRRGTFVAENPPHSEALDEQRRRLQDAVDAFVFQIQQLGVRPEAATEALDLAFAALAESDG